MKSQINERLYDSHVAFVCGASLPSFRIDT